jgi:hypothetical protein
MMASKRDRSGQVNTSSKVSLLVGSVQIDLRIAGEVTIECVPFKPEAPKVEVRKKRGRRTQAQLAQAQKVEAFQPETE